MSNFSIDFEDSFASLQKALGQDLPFGAVNLFAPAGTLFLVTVLQVTRLSIDPKWAIVTSVMTIAIDLFAGVLVKESPLTRRIATIVLPFVYLLLFDINPFISAVYVSAETVSRLVIHRYFENK